MFVLLLSELVPLVHWVAVRSRTKCAATTFGLFSISIVPVCMRMVFVLCSDSVAMTVVLCAFSYVVYYVGLHTGPQDCDLLAFSLLFAVSLVPFVHSRFSCFWMSG